MYVEKNQNRTTLTSLRCYVIGIRGRDRMVVGFTITYAVSAYHRLMFVSSNLDQGCVQHYVMKFVSDLRQVGRFLRVLRCPPPIKLTATI